MKRTFLKGAYRSAALLCLMVSLVAPSTANAVSAPIHIANTGGEGVFIRPDPNTSGPAIGWMPEGASPDYHCFVWGQNINGVPIWFNVTYNGVTGYYASFYDDSSYHSNEELTAKYGVPLCGAAPPAPQTPPSAVPSPTGTPPRPVAVYFNPYSRNDSSGPHLVGDGATLDLPRGGRSDWYGGCRPSRRPFDVAVSAAAGRPISTVSGWSLGRRGMTSFFSHATVAQLKQASYGLLIDPGNFENLECDRKAGGGKPYVRWLHVNRAAHLVIISGSLSQEDNSRGIQESYFNDVRDGPYPEVNSRVLICNYPINHQQAFRSSKYWIQHQIGSTRNACPHLLVDGRWVDETAGWHPKND
jgi:hypothetical protein